MKRAYLTVQDILWINLQITGEKCDYSYARLEESVFYQYTHINKGEITDQVKRLLPGFIAQKPVSLASQATAFVCTASFVMMNGYEIALTDEQLLASADDLTGVELAQAIADNLHQHETHGEFGVPETQEIVKQVLALFPQVISSLVESGRSKALFV